MYGSGDEDFAWLSHGGDPGSDAEGDAGELAVQALTLSGVHAGPDLEPERRQVAHERYGALDRAAGTVVLGLPARSEGSPCPIAAPYQAVRNIAAARALANGRKPVFALFFDARNPYFVQCKGWPGWPRALMTLAADRNEVAVRTCSWQRLLGLGAVPADVMVWAADKHGLAPSATVR